jgi:hypothetical protein
MVFLSNTAKLGPGDIAPIAQTNDTPISDFISISCKELVSFTQKGKLINNSNDVYLIITKSTHHPTNKKSSNCLDGF